MIHMERPSMVVNDQRSNRRYRMDETTSSSASTSMEALVARINRAAHQLGRPIENLILNSHGFPGGIEMGTGLHEGTMWPFHAIRGKVRKIWFRACLVAHIGPRSQDGHRFVRAFALLTQCHVIAPTERQGSLVAAPDWFPAQFIDTYEGLVLKCDPQGHVTRQVRFASLARLPDGRLQLPAGHE